jgi:hypothetical protein
VSRTGIITSYLSLRRVHPGESRGVARAIDTGIITTTDAGKVFTPQAELATGKDLGRLIFQLGKLAHSVEQYAALVRALGKRPEEVASTEDLAQVLGIRAHGEIGSVADLERLFRLE